jgi:hypothetical protein
VNQFTISVLQAVKTGRRRNPKSSIAVFDYASRLRRRHAAGIRITGHPLVFPKQQSVRSRRQPNATRRGQKHSDDARMVNLSIRDFVRRFKAHAIKSIDASCGRQPEESIWRLLDSEDSAKATLSGPRSVMVAL